MKNRCECHACSNDAGENRTKTCDKCDGTMSNKRVVCYDGISNGSTHRWVTGNGDPYDSYHGWSICGGCQNIESYIL